MKHLPFVVLLFISCSFSYAQKSTSKTLTIQYSINPTQPEPASTVTYSSLISSPLNPFPNGTDGDASARVKEQENVAKEKLKISGPKYNATSANGDLVVKLVTDDIKVVSTVEKSWTELDWNDAVFTYTCGATLTVSDKSGRTVFEKTISGATEEQQMPKKMMVSNPMDAGKFQLAKNNPEKTKKLADGVMKYKDNIAFQIILMKAQQALADAFETQNKTANVSVFSVKGKAYEELNAISEKIFEVNGKFHALSKKNRIPKEEMDKVLTESIATWEKFAGNSELEEQAKKGLLLNIALAHTWVGNYEKAETYFANVPEAKKTESFGNESSDTLAQGPNIILSFQQSAENLRNLAEALKTYTSRATISQ